MIPMPKSKPSQVIVHRIELQDKEREAMESLVAARLFRDVVQPLALVGGVGAASYVGYKAARAAYGWAEDIVDDVKEVVQDEVIPAILGKPYESDPATGKEYRNPFAGIPVLGPLFGAGINLGIATNPFAQG